MLVTHACDKLLCQELLRKSSCKCYVVSISGIEFEDNHFEEVLSQWLCYYYDHFILPRRNTQRINLHFLIRKHL